MTLRNITTLFTVSIILILGAGCSSVGLQSKRIFQDNVAAPVVKEVTEDIRQAADYLSKSVEEPTEARGVAIDLSQRVGSPERPIDAANDVSAALTKGNRAHQNDLADLMTWLDKREGTALEGTGLSVWGTGGFVVVLLIVVACVLMPALIPLVIQLVQTIAGTSRAVLKQTGAAMVSAISEWETENPTEAEELKEIMSRKMDTKSKTIVKKLKDGQL